MNNFRAQRLNDQINAAIGIKAIGLERDEITLYLPGGVHMTLVPKYGRRSRPAGIVSTAAFAALAKLHYAAYQETKRRITRQAKPRRKV